MPVSGSGCKKRSSASSQLPPPTLPLQWIDDLACLICGAGDNDEQLMLCEGALFRWGGDFQCVSSGQGARMPLLLLLLPPLLPRSLPGGGACGRRPYLPCSMYPVVPCPPHAACRVRPCMPQLLPGSTRGAS